MIDEEIIQLAEKTKKEKYCDKYRAIISGCKSECPFSNGYDYGCNVAYSEYQQAFLDGFKAAMELVKKRAAEVRKWYEGNNDISYEEGGKDALIDLLEEIER